MNDSNYFLETSRMYLRRFQKEDAAGLLDLDSDPEVMRFVSMECPTPMEWIQTDILPRFMAYYVQLPP